MAIENVQDRDLASVGQLPMSDVGLPTFIGLLGTNVRQLDRGRFCGCGLTKPRRDKIFSGQR
jgi:hypothetical protein